MCGVHTLLQLCEARFFILVKVFNCGSEHNSVSTMLYISHFIKSH